MLTSKPNCPPSRTVKSAMTFGIAPNRPSRFQSEGLVDEHVVNEAPADCSARNRVGIRPGGLTITLVLNSWYWPRSPSMKCVSISDHDRAARQKRQTCKPL